VLEDDDTGARHEQLAELLEYCEPGGATRRFLAWAGERPEVGLEERYGWRRGRGGGEVGVEER
jgi:hypothetical protein